MTDPNVQQNQESNLHEKERGIAAANQNFAVSRILIIVFFLFGALELLLAIRVILHLIGANTDNGFARFINRLSGPSVEFFANLVHNPTVGTTGVLEVTTLIAMIVYAILALSVVRRPSQEPNSWTTRRSVDQSKEMTIDHTTNWEQIAGKWKQVKGKARKQWGKLTDDELMQIDGNRDVLAGKIQEKYGIAQEEAQQQIDEWAAQLKA
jgi:uncharacterized protein YjbJ (UPF0337 family)